jgi:hypothetical protein
MKEISVSPLGRKTHQEKVSARALLLSPPAAPATTLAIELPDGRTVFGHGGRGYGGASGWSYSARAGVLEVGCWVPVTLLSDDPDNAELEHHHVPTDDEVGAVICEALGGPAVSSVPPDEWRIGLALRFAGKIIAAGGITPVQADAIRTRIRAGV